MEKGFLRLFVLYCGYHICMKPKTAIIGAGPAGASLAIRLAEQEFEVLLIERENFPRQKLCGEFISPECLKHFKNLGVLEGMLSAGGEHIVETRFYESGGRSIGVPSQWFKGDGYALSLSRAEMDRRLLNRARSVGVEVFEDTNVTRIISSANGVFGVKTSGVGGQAREIYADLFVDATGRSRVLSRLLEKQSGRRTANANVRKHSLVGFKSHVRGANLEKGRCEIYFFPGGYGGLSGIEDGLANHCFLITAAAARPSGLKANKIVENVVFKNKRAAETLKNAEPIREWLSVSIDGFGIKKLNPAPNLFSVGDSAAFIDPFTGSGMLMAFESSRILAECIGTHRYAPAKISELYTHKYGKNFARRLRICSLLRSAAFVPNLAKIAISFLGFSKHSREFIARSTRGSGAFISEND